MVNNDVLSGGCIEPQVLGATQNVSTVGFSFRRDFFVICRHIYAFEDAALKC